MTTTPNSQQLHAEVEQLSRRLRLPYLRKAAAEVLPTAKAQRWDPAEVVRVLLEEEANGRDAATMRNRRRRAGFPTSKTFDSWRETSSAIPAVTQQALRTLEWIRRGENHRSRTRLVMTVGRVGPGHDGRLPTIDGPRSGTVGGFAVISPRRHG